MCSLANDAGAGYHNIMDNTRPPNNSTPLFELEQRFKEHLLGLGLLTEITPPLPEDALANNRQPTAKNGTDANPVSDLVIKDCR
jgi:hypothetical protein